MSPEATKRITDEPGEGAAAVAPKSRRNRDAEVIAAGIDVFWRKGYAAASIQDLADVVGVLKGSLYHYIESKEDLLFHIFDVAHQEAALLMEDVRAIEAEPLARLKIYLERHVEQFLANPERTSLYFRDWRHLTGEHLATVERQRRDYERFVRDLIVEAQSNGDLDGALNPRYASLFVIGAINYVADWYRRDGRDSAEVIAKSHAALAIGALQAGLVSGSPPRTLGRVDAKTPRRVTND
jgi:AcrR family transcriptional regulator